VILSEIISPQYLFAVEIVQLNVKESCARKGTEEMQDYVQYKIRNT